MMFLLLAFVIAGTNVAQCPNSTCRHEGTNCIRNCSTEFCLCDMRGVGSRMTTANGTVCYDDYQVFANDARCLSTPVPSQESSPSQGPNPNPNPSPNPNPCTCSQPGVQCIQQCQPYLCLCGSSLQGTMLPTAPSTVCADGYQVWASSPVCSASSPVSSVCSTDGFYCPSHCSLTYYECSNGVPSTTMLVPYGTVCGITQNNTGELIYPNACNATNLTCQTPWLQCPTECGTSVQVCMNNVGYALQTVPSGLLCYNNQFVLSSQPVCSAGQGQSQDITSFAITVRSENTSWTILSDSAVAASVVDSLASAGSNVAITQSMVAVSDAANRRLQKDHTQIHRFISVYAPQNWDSTVVAEILDDSTGRSLLADALQFRRYRMETTTISSTPTLSPVANYRMYAPNTTGSHSNLDAILIGTILGGGICVAILYLLLRRACVSEEMGDMDESTLKDTHMTKVKKATRHE
jgi:hypothetical protein